MAMGKILACLIPDDPLIPLLNKDAQPAAVVATRNSLALSNIVVPIKPRGSGKLNNEPSSSKHNEELMRKNANLERQLRDVQKSIDKLKSPRSHQQTLDLDSAPLNLSITVEPYQEGFKIPHLETYDGLGDPDEYLHTYQAIMRIQNANDAMMCKVFPVTLKSTAKRWYHKLPRHSIDSYSQLAKLFSNKFASQREIKCTATELMQEQPLRREEKKKQKVNEQWGKPADFPKYANYIPLTLPRSQILAQIQHWVRKPPPPLHDSPRANKSKHCDYHRTYGHNTEDCQHLKNELEFLAHNGKLEGYLGGTQDVYQDNQYPSEQGKAYRGRQFNRRGQGQRIATHNQKDRKGVGYAGIPLTSDTINMISDGIHSGGQSARGRKAYARQVMTVNKNRPLKRPFEEVEWENAPITFSSADYNRAKREPDVMMPHADPFVATVHIGNHNVNKVFIDTGILKGNQKMARAYYQDTFKKVELVVAPRGPSGVEPVEPVEPIETVPLNPDVPERTIKIRTKLTEEERAELLEFLRVNQDVFAWTTNEMPGIPAELTVHKLSMDPTKRLACPKDPHPLPNVEKLVERAIGHEQMSFLDASSRYHQVQLLLDDQEKTAFYAGDTIYYYVMMPFGLKNADRVATLHKFIARLAERCLPFFKALREPKNFQWTEECQQAFDELKQYLASAPLLSKPVEGESLYLYLGFTKEAISSILLREENKHQKPICYVSKVLQGAKQDYSLAEKAAFALVCTTRKLRAYFQSHQIIVYTDLSLKKILQKPKLSGWLIGWSVELKKASKHPIWVLYVDGVANVEGSGAGAVLMGPDGFKSEHALRFASFQIDKIPRANNQRADELSKLASSQDINPHRSTIVETTPLIDYLHSGELPQDPSAAKLIKHRATHFTLLDNQFYKRAASMPLLRCLTSYQAEYAVREVREGVCGTHIGEMLSSLSSSCPFAQWGVDLLGPFVKSKGGCTYLVVSMDYFTKWIEAKPLSTTTEKKIEEFLFNSILCRFGIPKRIIADNGSQFRAATLRSFYTDYGIELALTSVYTSQSNGQAESANKIVLRGLKTRVLATHSNWVDELNKVLWSCRTTPSSATGETPFSLVYGAKAVILVEVGLPSDRSYHHDDLNNEQLLRENLDLVEEVREMSQIKNMAYQRRVAKFYNKRVRACQFKVGDLVLHKAGLTNTYSHMGKLAPNWEGPYMVIQIKRPGSYVLADIQGRRLPYIWNKVFKIRPDRSVEPVRPVFGNENGSVYTKKLFEVKIGQKPFKTDQNR
ncbi:hypothetical protein SLEP1_g14280 [Rubroshorea leprosula]|uniref:Integrase catalytic domain-containing protein n=1 Tax=Rubroshorea leprosula TaxID=152421 RepID=A0AAV5IU42_9ROSI|nr:hypothetical protein SLEP1_g14280 [Rubroshorea leprosula]